jgi:ABC-type branched-subunit amino acid transport system ATPase component
VEKFTVLVGPNNVGKSQTLRDIHQKLIEGPNARSVIVDDIIIEKPATFDELLSGLTVVKDLQHVGLHRVRGIASNLTSGENIRLNLNDLRKQFENSEQINFIFGNISKFRVSYLDAESRLKVAKSAESHNPHVQPPQNLLQGLFESQDGAEPELRDAFMKTFGMDLRLDYSGMRQLAIRVAKEFDDIPDDPRAAYPIFAKYGKLDEQGDGFRSFVGVVLSLLLSEGRVILLDEPEAFLHPAQARQLGMWIADHASAVQGQIIVATHNANFLSGILVSDQPVDIFRMNRTDDLTTYTRISPEATSSLVTHPLLSSQRVLEAIFFRGVVVCEADADRAVYQTVATQFLQNQEAMFLHAHNKQSVPQVVKLLRAAHIPVVAIVDLDALNSDVDLHKLVSSLSDTGTEEIIAARNQLAALLGMPADNAILSNVRSNVEEFLKQLDEGKHNLSGARGALNRLRKLASDWYDLKTKGLSGFPPEALEPGRELLESCRQQGLFLVPVGELESWLDLGTSRKNVWVVKALEALHDGTCTDELQDFVRDALSALQSTQSQQKDGQISTESTSSKSIREVST